MDSSPESISDTENWLNWNGDFDNPNDSQDDWEADNQSHMELDNSREDSKTPGHLNVSAAPNIPRLIRPTWQSQQMVEYALMTVHIIETRLNKGI